ncbi:MAG: hypothetical protein M1840_000807 [Geoglossum simile]|nr:MAG: hypothetical protein M1840_000807 [Geoglossum simile]
MSVLHNITNQTPTPSFVKRFLPQLKIMDTLISGIKMSDKKTAIESALEILQHTVYIKKKADMSNHEGVHAFSQKITETHKAADDLYHAFADYGIMEQGGKIVAIRSIYEYWYRNIIENYGIDESEIGEPSYPPEESDYVEEWSRDVRTN